MAAKHLYKVTPLCPHLPEGQVTQGNNQVTADPSLQLPVGVGCGSVGIGWEWAGSVRQSGLSQGNRGYLISGLSRLSQGNRGYLTAIGVVSGDLTPVCHEREEELHAALAECGVNGHEFGEGQESGSAEDWMRLWQIG